jgi:hypothetical protein
MASPLVLAILQPGCVSEAGDDLTAKGAKPAKPLIDGICMAVAMSNNKQLH